MLFPPALPPPSAEPHQQKIVFEISTGPEYGKDSIWSLNGLIPLDTCSGGQLPIVTTTQHELGSVGTQRKNPLPGLSGATFFLSVRYPERRWSGNSHIHDTDPKNSEHKGQVPAWSGKQPGWGTGQGNGMPVRPQILRANTQYLSPPKVSRPKKLPPHHILLVGGFF